MSLGSRFLFLFLCFGGGKDGRREVDGYGERIEIMSKGKRKRKK